MAKDIKFAAPRTQVYVAALQRKHGASAQELKDAVTAAGIVRRAEGFTSHNSYSLQLLANTYGYQFLAIDYTDGIRRYFFRSAKNAEIFDKFAAEQKAETLKAQREAEQALAARQAEKDAKIQARAQAQAEKMIAAAKSEKPVQRAAKAKTARKVKTPDAVQPVIVQAETISA